jgi:hypothetical protein
MSNRLNSTSWQKRNTKRKGRPSKSTTKPFQNSSTYREGEQDPDFWCALDEEEDW